MTAGVDYAAIMEPVARHLLGEPNRHLSKPGELRFGSRGSLTVYLKTGTWADYETDEHGGVLDLVARELHVANGAAFFWLKQEGFVDATPEPFEDRVVATYTYHDADGKHLFDVVRLRDPKDFRQRSASGDWSMKSVPRVLYRLPQLLAAPGDALVFVTEGEKDADRLAGLGLSATTNCGGANKWRDSYASSLAGRRVAILADNDAPGRAHAEKVRASLEHACVEAAVVDLEGLPLKGDVSDWLDRGGTAEQLVEIAEAALRAPKPAANGRDDDRSNLGRIEQTEQGVAAAFVTLYVEVLRFDYDRGRWFQWSGDHWREDASARAFHYCCELAHAASAGPNPPAGVRRASFAAGVERIARANPALVIGQEAWDTDPWLLGCPGVTIDLRTGIGRRPDPADRITKLAAIAPAETADCPVWLGFLEQATGDDAGLIRFLQQWCGYSLTANIREEAFVFIFGDGGTGKTSFVNVLSGVMADYATATAMETLTASKFDRHPTELAALRGARLVTASETQAGRAWADTRVKALTGGDRIKARFMRQDEFEFTPVLKLTIVGNHRPVLHDVDEAMRRRLNMVPFTRKPAEVDLRLDEKLRAEWPGILRWMIGGGLDWQQNGLIRPRSVLDATAEYFDAQDAVGQWLEAECICERANPHRWETAKDLFASWRQFAEAAGEPQGSQKALGDQLSKRGFVRETKRVGSGTAKCWLGLNLNRPETREP